MLVQPTLRQFQPEPGRCEHQGLPLWVMIHQQYQPTRFNNHPSMLVDCLSALYQPASTTINNNHFLKHVKALELFIINHQCAVAIAGNGWGLDSNSDGFLSKKEMGTWMKKEVLAPPREWLRPCRGGQPWWWERKWPVGSPYAAPGGDWSKVSTNKFVCQIVSIVSFDQC